MTGNLTCDTWRWQGADVDELLKYCAHLQMFSKSRDILLAVARSYDRVGC
jgi:hypothetical protein